MLTFTEIFGIKRDTTESVAHMAWEYRGNNKYYYRKRRVGSRVVSEYIGTGPAASILSNIDDRERSNRRYEHIERQREFERMIEIFDEIDRIISPIDGAIKAVTNAFHLVHGYHTHKGQWRKKRNES